MSSCVSFHTQIASIMEVLANTAVAEICKLVDDGYAVLRLEVSDSREENKALKRKLQLMEMRLAREACVNSRPERTKVCTVLRPSVRGKLTDNSYGDPLPGARKVFRKRKERPLTKDGKADGTTLDVDNTPIRPVDTWDECLDLEEERAESLLVKEEKQEEESDLHKGPHFHGDAAELGANGRGGSPALDSGTGPRKGLDKSTDPEQHGSRRGGWEVSGLDSGLKAEEQNDCVTVKRLQHSGYERSLGSECVMFERDSHLGNFFSQEDGAAEAGDLSCLSRTAANSDAILAQTEPPYESAGSGNSASSMSSLDWKTGIVVIDSMPIKEETEMHASWSRVAFSGAVDALSRSSGNRREREVGILETVVDQGPMSTPITARQETPEVQDHGVSANHFTASEQSDKLSFRVSSRGKRFFCAFCGKGFSCPKKVEIHQRVHTGEKPFSCTQCRKQFAQAGNLKRHQRVHTGEKPFSCTQCEKRFSHLHQLKMHLKVHTGERPYPCPHCGKRFAERSYLRIHQQRNHSVVYSIR